MNKSEIISFFNQQYTLNEEQKLYLEIHAKRFKTILALIDKNTQTKTLDIGPSFLSELLYQIFGKNLTLLGFKNDNSFGGHLVNSTIFEKVKLMEQDLNFFKSDSRIEEKFDLIICAEVIEHLYTSPKKLFQNCYHLLNKNGILIIQTPNAASVKKKIVFIIWKKSIRNAKGKFTKPWTLQRIHHKRIA